MTHRFAFPACAAIAFATLCVVPSVTAQTADLARSEISFGFKQETVPGNGKFRKFSAQVTFDAAKPEATKAAIEVDVTSVDLGDPGWNTDIQGASWFDTRKFPKATFMVGGAKPMSGGRFEAPGKFTLKGVTRDVVATFTAKSCGGPYNDLEGCDLKKVLATGAKVDVRAGVKADNSPLKLRSDLPGIVEVVDLGGTNYTLVGKNPGRAVITAFDGSGDRDRISITVDDMAMISYLEVSSGAGDFKLQPVGDVDGTFALRQTVQNFTLLFAPIDAANNKMLGRESFTTELQPGLYFQPGKENPTAMQMDLMRPTQAGTYSLLLRAKVGPGRFKLLISTP